MNNFVKSFLIGNHDGVSIDLTKDIKIELASKLHFIMKKKRFYDNPIIWSWNYGTMYFIFHDSNFGSFALIT